MVDMTQLESAIWRVADGRGNDEDVELLRDAGATSLSLLARLIGEAEDGLASARDLAGDERGHVVADFTDTVESLRTTADLLRPAKAAEVERPPDEVVLQASWSAGARCWPAVPGALLPVGSIVETGSTALLVRLPGIAPCLTATNPEHR